MLGKPKDQQKTSSGSSWFYEHEGPNAKPVDWVTFAGRRVVGVETRDPRQRTRRGIGPGDSLKALKKAYPGVRCKPDPAVKWVCKVFTPRGKRRVVNKFVFFKSEISVVDVGRIGSFG